MVKNNVSEWVREGLKKGYSKEQLRQELLKKGYSGKDTDKALGKKSAKKIIFIALIILIIIASVIVYLQINKKVYDLTPLQKELEGCKKTANEICLSFTEDGNETGEYAPFYYFGEAVRTNDTSLCDKMGIASVVCKAYLNNDLSYCNKSSEDYQDCITIISSKKDSSLCYNLKQIYQRGICLAQSTQNSSYCKPASDEKCYAEYYGKAYLLTGDSRHCEKITDNAYKKCCIELKNLNTENCIIDFGFYQCVSTLNPDTVCRRLE